MILVCMITNDDFGWGAAGPVGNLMPSVEHAVFTFVPCRGVKGQKAVWMKIACKVSRST